MDAQDAKNAPFDIDTVVGDVSSRHLTPVGAADERATHAPGWQSAQPVRPLARKGRRGAKAAVVACDTLAIALAMTLAAILRSTMSPPEAMAPVIVLCAATLPLWLCVFARYKLYTAAAVTSVMAETNRIVHAVAAATACTALISFVVGTNISRAWLLFAFVLALPLVIGERAIVRRAFVNARTNGTMRRRVVVVGTNAEAVAIAEMLGDQPRLGYEVVGLLECGPSTPPLSRVPVLGSYEDAVEIFNATGISGAIIASSSVNESVANRLARDLIELGYYVELTSNLVDISADRLIARPLGRRPVLYIEPVHRFGWRAVAKRGLDMALAAFLLLLASPLLAIVAVLIKLESRGPVLFRQVRVGKDGELFEVFKLRTMVADAELMLESVRDKNEMDGPLFKMRDDPRVTRVGAFLRRTSIDELPQLWNVLSGQMSMVGPRPAIPAEVSQWSGDVGNRLRVKPGITGMWQVNGRSRSSFDDYVRLDLYYVDNWSLLADIAIVVKTVPTVLLRRGAF
ncbi:MAG TPA: sugar transferase [Acidimicrobiia bacterium]|nr:sugar transferase [Acidimicrobiia bacterium]